MASPRQRNPGLSVATVLVYLFLYAPIAVLVIFSFNRSRLSARWLGFTTEWYGALWANDLIFQCLLNSLLIVRWRDAGVRRVRGRRRRWSRAHAKLRGRFLLDGLVYLPLVIPEIVIAVALVIFFSLLRLDLSLWTIIIAHITFCISFVIIVVGARLAGMDRTLREAALDLGANEWTAFFRVTLPSPPLEFFPPPCSSSRLRLTITSSPRLFRASARRPCPCEIYSMLKRGITPEINAISTVILLATVPLVLISQRLESGTLKMRAALAGVGGIFLLMTVPLVARTWPSARNRSPAQYLHLDDLSFSARRARLRARVPLQG